MIRLLGAITGSALALAALLVLVGIPQFKAEPNAVAPNVVTLPLRVEPVEKLVEAPPHVVQEQAPVETAPAPTEVVAAPVANDDSALLPGTQQWYAFWSPFRSEIAAAGFVTQLQRVTGLDYRVVRIKPGIYEVAFAYADDTDIPINLSQISAATGLELPEG